MKNPSLIIPYDRVDRKVLEDIAKRVAAADKSMLHKAAIDLVEEYFKGIFLKPITKSCIEVEELLGCYGACIVLNVESDVVDRSLGFNLAGVARLLHVDGVVPLVILFEGSSAINKAHEKIHLCQYLLNDHYPVTQNQFLLLMESDIEGGIESLERVSAASAMEFAINSICYKVWIELEANFFALGVERTKEYDLWAYKSYRSSLPFESVEELFERDGWGNDFVRMAYDKMDEFFQVVSNSSGWVDDHVAKAGYESLSAMLWEMHERFEDESLFGPITDEDIERFRIESEKQSDL